MMGKYCRRSSLSLFRHDRQFILLNGVQAKNKREYRQTTERRYMNVQYTENTLLIPLFKNEEPFSCYQ